MGIDQDNPRPWLGKKKATSPLEAETMSKKQRDDSPLTAESVYNEQLHNESAMPSQADQIVVTDNNSHELVESDDHVNSQINDDDTQQPHDYDMNDTSHEPPVQSEHGETQSNSERAQQLPSDTD